MAVATMTVAAAAQRPCVSTLVGNLRVQTLHSKTFGDDQTLRVWVPPGYGSAANAGRKYPVLYMMDGQNLFDVCTAGSHAEWKIDETVTRLMAEGKVEPMIVVGIDSSATRRADELIPYPDVIASPGVEPHGKLYPTFLVDEVMPVIEKQFRVKTGPRNTGIGGSSYGSVAAVYACVTRPGVFGLGLFESTSNQVGNGELLRATRGLVAGPIRAAVGVGTAELVDQERDYFAAQGVELATFNGAFAHWSEELAGALRVASARPTEVLFVATPGAHHEEAAWAARFPAAIVFLFPPVKDATVAK